MGDDALPRHFHTIDHLRAGPSGRGTQDALQRLKLEHHLFIRKESRKLRLRRLGAFLELRRGYREYLRPTALSA
eukprot:scaffold36524_cov50-Phaeocystis_antarctica.AAC.3